MSIRKEFEKRIEKKQGEIASLERQIGEAKSYLEALQDSIKILPRDQASMASAGDSLRPGSDMDKAREIIKKNGKPMYITELLKALGKEDTKNNRLSLSGSLSGYVRKGRIFSRTGPNIFGLLELENDLPEGFGEVDKAPDNSSGADK